MGRAFNVFGVIIIFCYTLESGVALQHKHTPCVKEGWNNCKCTFPDGQGIDLTPLRTADFGWISSGNHSIFFTACGSGFKNSSVECFEASVCLCVNDTIYTNLGGSKDGHLYLESISREPFLEFNVNSKLTTIQLKCNPLLDKPSLTIVSLKEDNYVLELTSRDTCLKALDPTPGGGGGGGGGGGKGGGGMGFWGAMMIILFVMALVYFLGGFLVLRFIQGARGVEAIPNHDFWLHLPTHIKNGALFMVNGCRTPTSYDRI